MTDGSHPPPSTDRQQKRTSHVARLAQQYERHRLGDTDDDAKITAIHTNKNSSVANKAPPPPPPVARLHSRSPSRTNDNPFLDTYSADIPNPPSDTSTPLKPTIPPSLHSINRSLSPTKPIQIPSRDHSAERRVPAAASSSSSKTSQQDSSLRSNSMQSPPVLPKRPAAYRDVPAQKVTAETNRPVLPVRPSDPQASQRNTPPRAIPDIPDSESSDDARDEFEEVIGDAMTPPSPFPDTSRINRRKPIFDRDYRIEHHFKGGTWNIAGGQVCTGLHNVRVWNIEDAQVRCTFALGEATKIVSLCFKPNRNADAETRYLWCGTKDGTLIEFDVEKSVKTYKRSNAHSSAITHLLRSGFRMWTIDDGGKLQVWSQEHEGSVALDGMPRGHRISAKQRVAFVIETDLWTADDRQIQAYRPASKTGPFNLLPKALDTDSSLGDITCGTFVPRSSDIIVFGHENGKISVWDRNNYTCKQIIEISLYKIVALQGVWDHLWAGFKTGNIYVYKVDTNPWVVVKAWRAHKTPVLGMKIDIESLRKFGRIQVASQSESEVVLWDGMMTDDWLDNEMTRRQESYCTFRDLRVLICSWNVDASKPVDLLTTVEDQKFLDNCLHSTDSPDIISFGFQEMIDLESKKMTAKTLFAKKKSEKTLAEHVTQRYKLWHDRLVQAVRVAMPPDSPYVLVHSENLVGLFTCMFIKESYRRYVKDLCVTTVKTGMGGLHGNKGAIVTRFIMDDSSLCFVNCHLAAGQSHTMQRNNDLSTILETAALEAGVDESTNNRFFVGGGDGTLIFDHEICFLSGDLNYRIDLHRDKTLQYLKAGRLDELLAFDQLKRQIVKNPGFRLRSFTEHNITFSPTYKYDPGTDRYDTSDKQRSPAWCDRILYRGRNIRSLDYRRYEAKVSDHKPISGVYAIRLKSIDTALWQTAYNDVSIQCQKMRAAQVEVNKTEARKRLSRTDSHHQHM